MVMAALLAAAVQPSAPPAPPLPRSGQMACDLRDQQGATVHLNGTLGLSEPRVEGRRFSQVTFTADNVPELAGLYEVQWTGHGGHFLGHSTGFGVAMHLVSWTFGEQAGAISVHLYPVMRGPSRYFAGFCRSNFSSQAGSDPK